MRACGRQFGKPPPGAGETGRDRRHRRLLEALLQLPEIRDACPACPPPEGARRRRSRRALVAISRRNQKRRKKAELEAAFLLMKWLARTNLPAGETPNDQEKNDQAAAALSNMKQAMDEAMAEAISEKRPGRAAQKPRNDQTEANGA